MKFALKDYQEEAVRQVLDRLGRAAGWWRDDRINSTFSLSAIMGAGKTVIAAAVLETLFRGNDAFDFDPDPTATVLWFSDSPTLNEQSRFRLLQASDRIPLSNLVIVQNTFQQERFAAGNIYFLNTQKLGKKSMLVRGDEQSQSNLEVVGQRPLMPDRRSLTIWDTIRNTIEDESLTLYLVLDEAHRGMGEQTAPRDRGTIVQRLITGRGDVPAMPIVWGISATVGRFEETMQSMTSFTRLPPVKIDSAKVHESGLLKDDIIFEIPKDAGAFDTVLVRRGADKLKAISAAWGDYTNKQGGASQVLPLLVLQVPNMPNPDDIGQAIDTIYAQWPELPEGAVAHVFGDHTEQVFGRHKVPYVSPERVQESTDIRVLIAKDAISTGWDCPRAEVMVSLRPARDQTYITQLLGRMVRTPLARRIPGDERLNSVECLLPLFDPKAVIKVAESLGIDAANEDADIPSAPGRRVLVNAQEMLPNEAVPDAVWDALLALPSQSLPKPDVRPLRRLIMLAHYLAEDGLRPKAGEKAYAEMLKVLDGARVQYKAEVKVAEDQILTVEGQSVRLTNILREEGEVAFTQFLEEADQSVIDEAYRQSARSLSAEIAKRYCEHLADDEDGLDEDALVEARITVAALGRVEAAREALDREAKTLSDKWIDKHRVDILSLSDERQGLYRALREDSIESVDLTLVRPRTRIQPTAEQDADGAETPLPRYPKHLLCAEDRLFAEQFNVWEGDILCTELQRPDLLGWYRNPSRASQDSLGVTYEEAGQTKLMRPDFIFFGQVKGGPIYVDIIDPHGMHLSDALPKIKGLARYAELHGDKYRRIESITKIDDKYRVLNLADSKVRDAVDAAKVIQALYKSKAASDYNVA